MYQVCYRCGAIYGEKEPLEDKGLTHGLCPVCLPIELKQLEDELDKQGIGGIGHASNAFAQGHMHKFIEGE